MAEPGLYWWQPTPGNTDFLNFGDELSRVIVERILERKVSRAEIEDHNKLLAVGSVLQFAKNGDVIWGSGVHGSHIMLSAYQLHQLDIRALRGPLSRTFLICLGLDVPEVYGDPALLLPLLFPELKPNPQREYLVIPHLSEICLFPRDEYTAFPDESWDVVLQKILESKLVISSSLHGIIAAEAFGIPARWLRITQHEPEFKYHDYFMGTGREKGRFAQSIQEALKMGGEEPATFDLEALLNAFPHDLFDRAPSLQR